MEIKNYNEHYNFNKNNGTLSKQQKQVGPKPLKRFLIVIDDCLGDPAWQSFNSELANFCTRSRHLAI
jgi:hypothetical protein